MSVSLSTGIITFIHFALLFNRKKQHEHWQLDIFHIFLVDFLCMRVFVRVLAAADHATGWVLSSVPVHATGRARSNASVN